MNTNSDVKEIHGDLFFIQMVTNIHNRFYYSATGNVGNKVTEHPARIQELGSEGRKVEPAVSSHDLVLQATSTTKHTGNKTGPASSRKKYLWLSS